MLNCCNKLCKSEEAKKIEKMPPYSRSSSIDLHGEQQEDSEEAKKEEEEDYPRRFYIHLYDDPEEAKKNRKDATL